MLDQKGGAVDLTALELRGLRPSLDRKDAGQVSHGLNLVLKLKYASSMPLLLAKIRQPADRRRPPALLGTPLPPAGVV